MIICDQCGSANEDGESFCGACGAYLEWDPKPAEPEPAPVEEAPALEESVPEPAKITILDRVKAATGLADAPMAAGTAPPATPDPTTTEATPDGAAESGAAAGPTTGSVPGSAPPVAPPVATPAAAAAATPAAPKSAAKAPAATKPGVPTKTATNTAAKTAAAPVRPGVAAPKPRRRELPPEDRAPLPGETVCPACGAGNAPTRRFCRRCGADLVDAAVVPELPWYRRIFRRSPKAGPLAGARPKRRRGRRGYRKLVGVLVALGIVAAGVWYALPYTGSAGEAIRDRISGSQVVNPKTIVASSAQKGHPAAALRDGATNKYWSPAAAGTGKGQYIQATFAEPVRLLTIQVFNGSSETPKDYLTTARVETLAVLLTLEDGRTQKLDPVILQDSPGQQEITVGVSKVTGVRLTVERAYGAAPNRRLAVGEVAFFRRS